MDGPLRQVEMGMVDHALCEENLRKTRLKSDFVLEESFICAGGKNDVDVCTGDGGGPLVCPGKDRGPNGDLVYYQVSLEYRSRALKRAGALMETQHFAQKVTVHKLIFLCTKQVSKSQVAALNTDKWAATVYHRIGAVWLVVCMCIYFRSNSKGIYSKWASAEWAV